MEESRFTLNGALLLLRKGGIVDGGDRRPSPGDRGEHRRNCRASTAAFRALLPRKAMARAAEAGERCRRRTRWCSFSGDDNHLFFQLGDRLLLSRKLTGNFPDYERVLPKDHPQFGRRCKRDEFRARDRARGAVRRRAFARDPRAVSATGEVKIHSSVSETGESEESVPAEYAGPDLEIGFNAQYLLDFLRAVPQDQVAFELKDPKSAGELRPGRRDIADQLPLRRHADAHLKSFNQ